VPKRSQGGAQQAKATAPQVKSLAGSVGGSGRGGSSGTVGGNRKSSGGGGGGGGGGGITGAKSTYDSAARQIAQAVESDVQKVASPPTARPASVRAGG
jgi:hypothetical protein